MVRNESPVEQAARLRLAVDGDLLPKATADRIRRFLDGGLTGQIVLEVKDGRVLKGHVTEHWAEQRADPSHGG